MEVTTRDIRRINNVHLFSPWKVVYKSWVGRFGGGLYRINMLCNLGFLLSIHFDFFEKSDEIFFIESPAFTTFFLENSVCGGFHSTRDSLRIKVENDADLLTPCKAFTENVRSKPRCMSRYLRDILLKSNRTKLSSDKTRLGVYLINPEGPKFLLQWINEILDRQIQQILEIILREIVLLLV